MENDEPERGASAKIRRRSGAWLAVSSPWLTRKPTLTPRPKPRTGNKPQFALVQPSSTLSDLEKANRAAHSSARTQHEYAAHLVALGLATRGQSRAGGGTVSDRGHDRRFAAGCRSHRHWRNGDAPNRCPARPGRRS